MLEVGKKYIVQDMLLNTTVTRETGSLGSGCQKQKADIGRVWKLLETVIICLKALHC